MAKNIDLLLGKIALEKGYLTRNQLDDCVAAQEREQRETGTYRPLGEIMLLRGVIDQPTLQELIKLQQEKFRKTQEFSVTRREDGVFGQLLIERKLVPADKVNECLRVQEQMAERDIHLRLGEVLVKKGCLTAAQVREVLLLQRKVIMTCPACKKNYNVPGRKEGVVVRCPRCSTELRPPDLSQTISAAGTTAPGSGEGSPAPRPQKGAGDFGRYDLLEELGEGGMGIVYKAWDKELRRLVALKMLKGGESQPQQVERFLREARAAAKLRHPNIVQIHDVGAMGDKHYFTMDFIEGASLQDQTQTDSGLALPQAPDKKTPAVRKATEIRRAAATAQPASDQARKQKPHRVALRKGLEILRDIAFALDHAHSQGIIHRDIKPANILIDAAGTPFLTDFGLAKDFKHIEKSGLTVDGQVIGTPFYLSPELAAGDQTKLGPTSDIYSLGVIMFELLTGKRPYQADSFIALMWEIIHADAPAPHTIAPKVHRDLETICSKAIDKEPGRRYRTAREFGEDIQRYLDGEAIAARPLGAIPRAWRSIRRHAALAVAFAAVLVLASAAAAYFFYSSWKRRADIDANLREGTALLERQDWRNALDKFQKVIVLDPQNQQALLRSNECKTQIEKSGETAGAERRRAATPAYERAKLIIERLDEMAKRGEFKKGTEDLQRALVELDAALTHDPSFSEAHFLKGRSLHLLGRQADALDALGKAVSANPTFAAPYLERAAILLEEYTAAVQPQLTSDVGVVLGETDPQTQKTRVTIDRNPGDERVRKLRTDINADLKKVIELDVRPEESHCAAGVLLALDWKVEEAIAEFDKAISIFPFYADAYRQRGFAHLLGGDLKKALDDFNKAIECRPFAPESYVFRGNSLLMAGDLAAAIEDFSRAIEIRPDFVKAIVNRGTTLMQLGRFDEALQDLDRGIELAPESPDAYSMRAFLRLTTGDTEGALVDARKAYELKPQEINNVNVLAMATGFSGDLDEAVRLLTDGLAHFPQSPMLLQNRSMMHEKKRDLEAALVDLEEACRLVPDNAEYLAARVKLLRRMGRLDKAFEAVEEAIKRNDRAAGLYRERATLFLAKGDVVRAETDLDKAIGLDPRNAAALVERARLRLGAKNVEGAEADLDAAVKANPRYAATYFLRGKLRDIKKDLEGAENEYTTGLQYAPNDAELLFERGSARAARGNFQGAAADFGEIIRLDEKDESAYIARAKLCLMREPPNFVGAFGDLDKVVSLNDKNAEAYSLRGDCYRESGKLIKAQIDYEKAIELAPSFPEPHLGLGVVHLNEGRFGDAVTCLKKFLALAPTHPWAGEAKRILAEAEKRVTK